ncbi:hypothetical protein NKH77_28715 [Streptomyces sp. M19]
MSGTGANSLDSEGRAITNEQVHQTAVKPQTGRMFAFAIPTAWLTVAEVDRQIKDGPVATWVRDNLMGPFGGIKPGIQAVETSTEVIAWVREDVARQLGLITDDSFPKRVAEAWDKVNEAGETWAEADEKYWVLRREVPDLRKAIETAMARRSAARRNRDAARFAVRVADRAARHQYRAAVAAAEEASRLPVAEFNPETRERLRAAEDVAREAAELLRAPCWRAPRRLRDADRGAARQRRPGPGRRPRGQGGRRPPRRRHPRRRAEPARHRGGPGARRGHQHRAGTGHGRRRRRTGRPPRAADRRTGPSGPAGGAGRAAHDRRDRGRHPAPAARRDRPADPLAPAARRPGHRRGGSGPTRAGCPSPR